MRRLSLWQRVKIALHTLLCGSRQVRDEAEWLKTVNDDAERILARKGIRVERDVMAGRSVGGK